MWQEAEKILEVEAREAEYRVRREVEEAKREAEEKEAELVHWPPQQHRPPRRLPGYPPDEGRSCEAGRRPAPAPWSWSAARPSWAWRPAADT